MVSTQQLLADVASKPPANTAPYKTSDSVPHPPASPPQLLLPLYHPLLALNQSPNPHSESHLNCVQSPKLNSPYPPIAATHSVNDGHRKTINPLLVHQLNKASSLSHDEQVPKPTSPAAPHLLIKWVPVVLNEYNPTQHLIRFAIAWTL